MTKMVSVCLVVIFSAYMLLATGENYSRVSREGTDCLLNYSSSNTTKHVFPFMWKLQIGLKYVAISSCTSAGSCTDLKPESFRAYRNKSLPETIGAIYIYHLKVIRVNRSQTSFILVNNNNETLAGFNLNVYGETWLTSPCSPHQLIRNGTDVKLKFVCSLDNIYPMGECSMTAAGLRGFIHKGETVTFLNTKSKQNADNFKIECTWTADLSERSSGRLMVQTEFTVMNISVYSVWTEPVDLSYPTVSIATDCPAGSSVNNGYIMAGTAASCRCDVTDAGYPPGYAQWYTDGGVKLGSNEPNGSAILQVTPSGTDLSYVCQPATALKNVNPYKVEFTAKYAAGPTSIQIDMTDAVPLCPHQSFTYQVTCKVPSAAVTPRPVFTISINEKSVIENMTGIYEFWKSKHYVTYTFRPDSGGAIRVHCKATNKIFPSLSRDLERQLILKEPPKTAPVLSCLNGRPQPGSNIVYISNGSNVSLTCDVAGGFPEVSLVTISCGEKTWSMLGSLASVNMAMPTGVNKVLCRCTARHDSECYNLRSDIILSLEDPETTPDNRSYQTIVSPETATSSNDALVLGLGGGLGGVGLILIIVVVVVVISWRIRRNTRDMVYNEPDFNSCASYQYASFVPGRNHPPLPPLPIQPARDCDYDVIALTADVIPTSQRGMEDSLSHGDKTYAFRESEIPEGYEQPI